MGSVPSVVLPSAVGIGAGALGHAEDQLALARLAGWQFGDGELARGDASVEFGACHVSEVVTWPVYTKRGGGQGALMRDAFQNETQWSRIQTHSRDE